jgi:hypothetical protein
MVSESPTQKTDHGEFTQLRDQLWWACREWLRLDPSAMLPPDAELIEELSVPTYEIIKGKIKIMPKTSTGKQKKISMKELLKRSPDKAEALIMTFYRGGFFEGCDLT